MDQKIEVGSSKNIEIYDAVKGKWHHENLDFSKYTELVILGKRVRLMEKKGSLITREN